MTFKKAAIKLSGASAPILWCACLVFPVLAQAQAPLDNLVFAVGTTIRDRANQDWSYVLLGSPQAGLLAGKRFAVYARPGSISDTGTYTLRGTLFQQTDAAAIATLLNQSLALGEDLTTLSNAFNVLLHSVSGIENLPLPQKVLLGFQMAQNDPSLARALGLMCRSHPGLTLCSGQAFAEPIGSPATYELREVNAATGAAGDVVGRVCIVPGSPVILPAPGAPYQVVTNAPIDHLVVRLRWGTPDALRRLSLLSFGFNVWRIPRAAAETANYHLTPPTLAQLYSDPNFTRANNSLVVATRNFLAGTGLPGTADDPTDQTTVFFTDSNGRSLGNVHFPANSPPHPGYLMPPFNDGDEFYYFITARDLLGRDGLVSPGGLAKACRRLPPQSPTEVKVANTVIRTNQSRLLVTWQQNTNLSDLVSEYWIYRWPNPSMALTNEATPLNYRVGVVPQAAATNQNRFLDDVSSSPVTPGATSFWYTVRAVSQAACAQLLSPQSVPAWGVLRQRAGPLAAGGKVLGSCGTPAALFQRSNLLGNEDGPDPLNWNYRFTCRRRDPGIAWVMFSVTNRISLVDTVGPIYFPPDGDTVQADYSLRINGANFTNDIWCVVGTYYGLVSAPAIAHFNTALTSTQRLEAVFLAGQLLETAADVQDPLFTALNGFGPRCLPAVSETPDPSGTVRLTFDFGHVPLLIQVLEAEGWKSLGIYTPDANNVYWIPYPGCLLGPLQPFQGCFASLAASDCAQHVARGADNGPVAPVHVQFTPTPRTREYRLYRSVDNGPLTLMAQGDAPFDPLNPQKQVVRTDDAMPPSAARLCYFVQVLDENGNGSPMSFLGCKEVKPARLPRPVLAEPAAAGSDTNPLVNLNWFCPTGGLYRFQLKIERADQPNSYQSSGLVSAKLSLMLNFNASAFYAGLNRHTKAVRHRKAALAHFDEAQLTPPIGANFGPGPQFSLTATVVPKVPYRVSVAAMDAQGNVGDTSEVWTFTWIPPVVLQNVPWPARPLPPVKDFYEGPFIAVSDGGFVAPQAPFAGLIYNDVGQLDLRHPAGICVGGFEALQNYAYEFLLNAVTTNFFSFTVYGTDQAPDPNSLIATRFSFDPTRRGESLLPIVVYRQQWTNAAFPRVSGHLTQVTPLIERLPYSVSTVPGHNATVTIKDRLFAAAITHVGVFDYPFTGLFLLDQQPVIRGASYLYYVVRFNEKHEIDEVIPAGFVTIPTSP